jgi:hypothetical protein
MSARLPKTVYTISNRRDAYAGCVRYVAHSPRSLIFAFRQRRDAVALRPYFSAPFKVEPHGQLMFVVKRLPVQTTQEGLGLGPKDLEVCNTGALDALARAYLNNTRLVVIDHVREALDKSSAKMVARFEIEDVEFDDSLRVRHLTSVLDSTTALEEDG